MEGAETSPQFIFYDLDAKRKSDRIDDFVFPDWDPKNERVVFLGPHDDDVLLGAGYLLLYCLQEGAEVYVAIFCDGSGGYSRPEDKDTIVDVRRVETINAYSKVGVKKENIVRFDYPDFCLIDYLSLKLPTGQYASTHDMIEKFRKIRPTRLIVPNEYREHLDHRAASWIGSFTGPQVGDSVLADLGEPFRIRSYLMYSVWGDFSPEDALVKGRPVNLRGNLVIVASPDVEEMIADALREFKSQTKIIEGLVKKRQERLINGRYLEVYMRYDPRPEMDLSPYKDAISEIDKGV
ncbi:MAG: PIG-L family deacetylase [Thaumarchaeota archaeon]|nr:PIG-L family deacetylase [Nitrososphaerota archaeon]